MSEAPREPGAAAAPERAERAVAVAVIAAVAAVVWCVCVFGAAAVPFVMFAAPASALLWLWIGGELERSRGTARRLGAALAWGLVSPLLGLALAWLPMGCCAVPCMPGVAGVVMFAHLWNEPWLYLPVGAGMGLVAFVVVSVRRPARPS